VHDLAELQSRIEITGQARNRRFRYDSYVRLFDEPDAKAEGAAQ